jgi:hypothetical protein
VSEPRRRAYGTAMYKPSSPPMNIELACNCVNPSRAWKSGAYRENSIIDPAHKLYVCEFTGKEEYQFRREHANEIVRRRLRFLWNSAACNSDGSLLFQSPNAIVTDADAEMQRQPTSKYLI